VPGKASSQRTYYDILDVTPKSKKEEIKQAYRRLAKKYHPDRNDDDPEAENRFKEVQTAYATLSDTWKKALYDQDLQFHKYGSGATTEVDKEKWTEHWEKETPEEREKRKERYKRYAAGERNDIPPDRTLSQWTGWIVIGVVGGVFYACVKAPEWMDQPGAEHFCDPMHDDRSVPLVRAYHDPVQNRWTRLPEGFEPPTPKQLYAYYAKVKPDLLEEVDMRLFPKISLTVMPHPRTDCVKSSIRLEAAAA